MKKTLLMAASALCITAFSTDALAGCDGIYLAARGGFVNHNLGNPSETTGDRLAVDDNQWFAAGAIGYRWGYWRFETEYTWRQESEETVKGSIYAPKTEFSTESYMANVYYDFSPYTMFTPYAMAGIGFTKLEFNYSHVGFKETIDSTEFTWALGGGISAKVTNRFNVDIGYRFLNMGDIAESSVRAHEVYLGLRYVF